MIPLGRLLGGWSVVGLSVPKRAGIYTSMLLSEHLLELQTALSLSFGGYGYEGFRLPCMILGVH